MDETLILTIKHTKGDLAFKTEWQSQDGRLCISYFGSEAEARKRYNHLLALGRIPKIWVDISDTPPEEERE